MKSNKKPNDRPTDTQLRLLLELSLEGGELDIESRHELGWGRWRARWKVVHNIVDKGWALRDRSRVQITDAGRLLLRRESDRVSRIKEIDAEIARNQARLANLRDAETRRLAQPTYKRAENANRILHERAVLARLLDRQQQEIGEREAKHLDREVRMHDERLEHALRERAKLPPR